jgi:hypothetical protein
MVSDGPGIVINNRSARTFRRGIIPAVPKPRARQYKDSARPSTIKVFLNQCAPRCPTYDGDGATMPNRPERSQNRFSPSPAGNLLGAGWPVVMPRGCDAADANTLSPVIAADTVTIFSNFSW